MQTSRGPAFSTRPIFAFPWQQLAPNTRFPQGALWGPRKEKTQTPKTGKKRKKKKTKKKKPPKTTRKIKKTKKKQNRKTLPANIDSEFGCCGGTKDLELVNGKNLVGKLGEKMGNRRVFFLFGPCIWVPHPLGAACGSACRRRFHPQRGSARYVVIAHGCVFTASGAVADGDGIFGKNNKKKPPTTTPGKVRIGFILHGRGPRGGRGKKKKKTNTLNTFFRRGQLRTRKKQKKKNKKNNKKKKTCGGAGARFPLCGFFSFPPGGNRIFFLGWLFFFRNQSKLLNSREAIGSALTTFYGRYKRL